MATEKENDAVIQDFMTAYGYASRPTADDVAKDLLALLKCWQELQRRAVGDYIGYIGSGDEHRVALGDRKRKLAERRRNDFYLAYSATRKLLESDGGYLGDEKAEAPLKSELEGIAALAEHVEHQRRIFTIE